MGEASPTPCNAVSPALPFNRQKTPLNRYWHIRTTPATPSETSARRFFAPEDIPWEQIYYPAIRQILERYIAERETGSYGIYMGSDDTGKVHFIR